MRHVALFLPALALALLAAAPAPAAPPGRVALVLWRGAGAALTERMLASGVMPHLAALKAEGLGARLGPVAFSGSGAAATLLTGARADRHGVTGRYAPLLPRERYSVLEGLPAERADALAAEPLFAAAARQGKRVLTLHAPHTTPVSVYGAEGPFGRGLGDRLAIFDAASASHGPAVAFTGGLAPAEGWRALPASAVPPLERVLLIGEQPFFALAYDQPEDPVVGYDTVIVAGDRSARAPLAVLKPLRPMAAGAWSAPLPVRTRSGLAHVAMRLYELSPDGSRIRLYHSAPAGMATNRPAWLPAFMQAGGALVGGAGPAYREGAFGPTLAEEGDGQAEARYLDAVRHGLYRLQGATRHLLATHPWELFVAGVPWPEEAVAMWGGYLAPGSPAYRPAIAGRLEPALRQVFADLDGYLGAVRQSLPAGTALVVAGDRALVPARWDFFPNRVLQEAGLLTLDADGQIDLGRTRALYPPADGGYIRINTTDWKGGIVSPDEAPAVLAAVRQALGAVRVKTPGGVVPLVRMLPPEAAPGLGGPAGGRLYLDLRPGYHLHSAWGVSEIYQARPAHASAAMGAGFGPEHQGVIVAGGGAVPRGVAAKLISPIDLAPTVSGWLGVAPPAAP
ncbi:MAG: alkaline phosphatase family protein [Candidatus Sericytochromatia bacterium]